MRRTIDPGDGRFGPVADKRRSEEWSTAGVNEDTPRAIGERQPVLTKRTELWTAGVFFAVVFGVLMGRELWSRDMLTPVTTVALAVISALGGLLFAFGFWRLYLRKHRL